MASGFQAFKFVIAQGITGHFISNLREFLFDHILSELIDFFVVPIQKFLACICSIAKNSLFFEYLQNF